MPSSGGKPETSQCGSCRRWSPAGCRRIRGSAGWSASQHLHEHCQATSTLNLKKKKLWLLGSTSVYLKTFLPYCNTASAWRLSSNLNFEFLKKCGSWEALLSISRLFWCIAIHVAYSDTHNIYSPLMLKTSKSSLHRFMIIDGWKSFSLFVLWTCRKCAKAFRKIVPTKTAKT